MERAGTHTHVANSTVVFVCFSKRIMTLRDIPQSDTHSSYTHCHNLSLSLSLRLRSSSWLSPHASALLQHFLRQSVSTAAAPLLYPTLRTCDNTDCYLYVRDNRGEGGAFNSQNEYLCLPLNPSCPRVSGSMYTAMHTRHLLLQLHIHCQWWYFVVRLTQVRCLPRV